MKKKEEAAPASAFRPSGFGFQVWGFGFRVLGLGVRLSGYGFRFVGAKFTIDIPVWCKTKKKYTWLIRILQGIYLADTQFTRDLAGS